MASRIKIPFAVETNVEISATKVIAPVKNASVSVVNRDTHVATTVFAAETGATTIPAPVTDEHGNIPGWLEEGSYTITVSGGSPAIAPVEYAWDAVRGDNAREVYAGTVNTTQLASNAVTAPKIAAEAVETAALKSESVTTAKLANRNVTAGKIAASAGIMAARLAPEATINAAGGELLYVTNVSNPKILLPSAEEGIAVGAVMTVSSICTLETQHAEKIHGDFVPANAEKIKLTENQHVVLRSTGTAWYIISGEPQRETKWESFIVRALNTTYLPSATRDTEVNINIELNGEGIPTWELRLSAISSLSAVTIARWAFPVNPAPANINHTFRIPAGQEWKLELIGVGGIRSFQSVYLHL